MKPERGQASLAAALAVLLLVLLAAGIVDLVRLREYRIWGYRLAESAALAGLAHSRDYAGYMATGELSLAAGVAQQDAVAALCESLNQRPDLTGIVYDVRVHDTTGAAVYAGYPPVARAGMVSGDWSPASPAVGVYVVFEVQPVLYGWVNGNATIPIHVFAAASIVEAH